MPIGKVPPPSAHPDDEPLVCLSVNQEWITRLIGVIQPMKYPEYWGGTLEQNRQARKDFGILLDQLMSLEDCNMAKCCEDTIYLYRQNPDTGRFERSSDGGSTWLPDPVDPIYVTKQLPPRAVPEGQDAKCNAATGFGENFDDIITVQSENLGTAVTVFELAAAVAAVIIDIIVAIVTEGVGAVAIVSITDAIFAAAAAAFTEGKTAFDDYWTNEKKDAVVCAAYLTIGDNGQFTQDQWDAFRHKVKMDLPPAAALDFVMTAANAAGFVGGSNMASYGVVADADCSECGDFCTLTDWGILAGGGTIDTGTRTPTHVEIDASLVGGNYYVVFASPAADTCCDLSVQSDNAGMIYTVSGSPTASWYNPCGTDPADLPSGGTSLSFGSFNMNGVKYQSATPFRLGIDTTL